MNAVHILEANEWVKKNRARLSSGEFGSQKDAAEIASKSLGFKVSTNALRDLMQANGIETRRLSAAKKKELAMTSEIGKLTEENQQLRRLLALVRAVDWIPREFKEFIFNDLNDEVRNAIFAIEETVDTRPVEQMR